MNELFIAVQRGRVMRGHQRGCLQESRGGILSCKERVFCRVKKRPTALLNETKCNLSKYAKWDFAWNYSCLSPLRVNSTEECPMARVLRPSGVPILVWPTKMITHLTGPRPTHMSIIHFRHFHFSQEEFIS